MYVLVLVNRNGERRKVIPLDADRVTIGSQPGSTILVRHGEVAACHCVLERTTEGGYKLLDQHTDHGTMVNGSYVVQSRLEPGDRIEFGGLTLLFERREGAVQRAAAHAVAAANAAAAPSALAPDGDRLGDPPRPPRRRRAGDGMANSVSWAIGVVVLLIGCAAVLMRYIQAPQGDPPGVLRLRAAGVLIDAALFDDASRKLAALARDAQGADPNAVETARLRLESERARAEHAVAGIAEIQGDAGLTVDKKRAALSDLESRYGDLVGVGPRVVCARVVADHTPPPNDDRALETVFGMADSFMATGNFAGARSVWTSLAGGALHCDRAVAAAGIESVEAVAEARAAKLLARVDEAMASGDLLGASILVDDSELNGFQGTNVYARLDARAREVMAEVTGEGSGLVPTPATGGRALPPSLEGSGAVAKTDEFNKPKAPTTSKPSPVAKAAIEEGDALFASGDLEGAKARYQAAMSASLGAFDASALARRVERANRASWLLDRVTMAIENDSTLAKGLRVRSRDGKVEGTLASVAAGQVRVETATGPVVIQPQELDTASVLGLAKRQKLGPEDQLNLACYALIDADAKTVDQALVAANADPALKTPLDSAIAFARGLPEVPEWGFYRYENRWLSFRERELAKNEGAVNAAFAQLDKKGPERAQAIDELRGLMPVARDMIADRLTERRGKMIADVAKAPELDALRALLDKRAELDRRRKYALELIFDEVKYFYPYRVPDVPPDKATLYPKVQQEVDARVDAVREVWGNEFDDLQGGVSISSKLRAGLDRILEEQDLLFAARPDVAESMPIPAVLQLVPRGASKVTLRTIAVTPEERSQLDRDVEVMAYNATSKTSATSAELDQIRITNQYRMMFGRRALRVHDKLVRAARGHSESMSRTGKFSHFEDDPARRTPGQRIALEGYKAMGAGENIAMIGGAMAAHTAWCHSSGHHRNILFEFHEELGVGNIGSYWTQNFAGGADYTGNQTGD